MAGGEFGSMEMEIEVDGTRISIFREYAFSSHFLTPCDNFRFVIGDEVLTPGLLDLLIPGKKVTLSIDGVVQATGYIDVVDTVGDRSTGTVVTIEGRDAMSPVVDAQIDPARRYPEKTPLDKLLRDVLGDFGFTDFLIDNEANRNVAANKAIPHKKVSTAKHPRKPKKKELNEFRIPSKKPRHNETYFVFLSRITQRYGLWIWSSVDGEKAIVAAPDFEQAPSTAIRYKIGGQTNNVTRGGIRRDSTDQPSYIVARGNIPPTSVEHWRMQCFIDNPYIHATPGDPFAKSLPNRNSAVGEPLSFVDVVRRDRVKFITQVPAQPISVINAFSSIQARPRFLKDDESHTPEELGKFVQRQMSLCTRRALVGKYEGEGHAIDGVVPQVDMVVDVDDERSRWSAPMWILSRSFSKSRSGGTTFAIETLPLGALVL